MHAIRQIPSTECVMNITGPKEQATEQDKPTFHLHSAARHPLKIKLKAVDFKLFRKTRRKHVSRDMTHFLSLRNSHKIFAFLPLL